MITTMVEAGIHIDGDVFEGEGNNGSRHGHGKYTYANGYSYEGKWENDTRVCIV